MAEQLVSLSDYPDQFQAEAIRIRLEAAGIQVIVTGTDAATALSLGGAGTDRLVRVEVAESDYQQAMKLLIADRERLASASPWICSRCDEQNEPAFEVCWGCNKTQSDDDVRGRLGDAEKTAEDPNADGLQVAKAEPRLGTTNDSNPFRPVMVDKSPAARSDHDRLDQDAASDEQLELTRRAFLSSVAALLLIPPLLSFYSVYLLCRLGTDSFRFPELKSRLIAAWAFNLVVIPLGVTFWSGLLL